MKNKSISVRLSQEEENILEYYKDRYHMNSTQVISALLRSNVPQNLHQQEIATAMCNLYIRLSELGLSDDKITLEVQRLCQMLS